MLGVLDKYRENARKNKNDSRDQLEEQKIDSQMEGQLFNFLTSNDISNKSPDGLLRVVYIR